YGERLRGCNVRNMNPEKAEGLSPELQSALEPLLNTIESLSERSRFLTAVPKPEMPSGVMDAVTPFSLIDPRPEF
ncbi:MAG: hypothetical protein WA800_20610, partial [Terriglobales bacterium]